MALALAREGAGVFITGARQPEELAATCGDLQALGVPTGFALADVNSSEECRSVVERATATLGAIDVLVNNAARGGPELAPATGMIDARRFWEVGAEAYARMVATNCVGPFLMTQAVLPTMLAQGHGRIVNISTSRPTMLWAGGGPYGPTKAFLETSSRIWASELAGTGVTVNVLLPGGPCDTALIPGQVGTRAIAYTPGDEPVGNEGKTAGLLPPEIMGPPIVWLAAAGTTVTGRRFVARDWDARLTDAEAAARASGDILPVPRIF